MGLYTNTPGCCEGRIYVVSFGEGIVIIIVVVVVVVAKQPYMIACTYIRIGGTVFFSVHPGVGYGRFFREKRVQ